MTALAIKLLVSDIDGTLVTPEKTLTPDAVAAVRKLAQAGVGFSVVSSRPPRGMAAIARTLEVRLPYAAFNGASLVEPDGRLISASRLSKEAARRTLDLLAARGVDAWVYADDQWQVLGVDNPRTPLERRTLGYDPTVVASFEPVIDRVDKIVGVSNDYPLLARVETETQGELGAAASAQLSQPYYLDVTASGVDKGHAVRAICQRAGVDLAATAVIGDMTNDVAMFRVAGLSIAMGQGPETVRAQADVVTGPNSDDGFARAVERFVLPRAAST